jgi:hypothetical protein
METILVSAESNLFHKILTDPVQSDFQSSITFRTAVVIVAYRQHHEVALNKFEGVLFVNGQILGFDGDFAYFGDGVPCVDTEICQNLNKTYSKKHGFFR